MDISAYNSYEQLRATEFRLGRASRDAEVATLRELEQAWHDKFWAQSKETNQLRQQLAASQKREAAALAACKLKDESLEAAHNGLRWWMDAFPLHVTEADNEEMLKIVKALAIQPDDTAWAQAHRLALELECLIMDTKDNVIVSKWWDSAFEALSEYHKLKPGAAEDAEAWAKIRKAGI